MPRVSNAWRSPTLDSRLSPNHPSQAVIIMTNRALNAQTLTMSILAAALLAGCAPAQKTDISPETARDAQHAAQPGQPNIEENSASDHTDRRTDDIPEDLKEYEMTYELSKDGPTVTTYCKDAHVTVSLLKDDKPYRVFDSEVDLMGNNASKTCIKLEDLNFDGIQDILVPTSIGMHNAYYRAWLWNPASSSLEEIPGFSDLGTPICHPETLSLEFGTHISASEYEVKEYRMNGNVAVFWRSLHIAQDPDTSEFSRTSKVSVEGRIIEKTMKVSPKEMQERNLESFQKEDAE